MTNLNLNVLNAFLGNTVSILRNAQLERARALNAPATELDTDALLTAQIETRRGTPTVRAWSAPVTDNVQAIAQMALVETLELSERSARKIAASAIKRDQKTRMLIRSILPIVAELAIKNAARFENDVLLAASAFYEEAQLAVMRFDAKKANRSSFADFCASSLKLRTTVLADEVCEGARKTHEAVRHLKGIMNELDLDIEDLEAPAVLKHVQTHFSEIQESVPVAFNTLAKIQSLLDLVSVTTGNGNFLSLDVLMSDDDGAPKRLIDVISLEAEDVYRIQQLEDEDAVRPVLEALQNNGVSLDTVLALEGKVAAFMKIANAKIASTMNDPQWAAVILETIGQDGLILDVSHEVAEELEIDPVLAMTLGKEIMPFYMASLSARA